MAVDGSGRSARRARKGRRAREGSRPPAKERRTYSLEQLRAGLRLMLGERHLPSGRAAAMIGHPAAARVLRRYAKEVRANTGLLHDDAATTRAWTPRETDVLTCAVIMSCGVWVNSVKSMLGKLIIHLESQAQELTNHTHTRPWLLTEGVLGWWSGEHMRTRSPTPGGGRAGRHAARSAGVCGAATATPRARTRRPRRQGCLPRRAARARTAPASLDL